MNKLTKAVLERPIATLVVLIALVVFGVNSITGLGMQLIPDINLPMMVVTTVYPQAGPEEVESLVTREIEDACGAIANLKDVTSQSSENFSMVIFQFEYGTDMNETYTDMQVAVNRIKSQLPADVQEPTILSIDMNASDAMTISIDTEKDVDLVSLVEEKIEPELKKISEVADLNISGGQEKYISIEVIPEYAKQYGVDISTLAAAITSVNFTMPAGSAEYGNQKVNLNSEVAPENLTEIEKIPITTSKGMVIQLSDVAIVQYSLEDAESFSRYNGNDNVSIGVAKKQVSSAVSLSNHINKTVERLQAENPELNMEVVYDSSESIKDSLISVGQTLIVGILLSMLVLFLFFGDFKASMIVGSSMPISLLVTIIMMGFLGYSLNLITMGALVIGIGMMVDNAIVVIEMCFRKKEEGFDYKEAAYKGTKVVMNSIIASTLTTIVVYLPLAMLNGMSGQMFSQLGYTIIFSLIASLVSAITIIPLFFSKYRPVEKKNTPVSRILDWTNEKYSRLLKRSLQKKKTVAGIAILIFAITIFLAQFLNTELMAATDEGQVALHISFRPGLQLDEMNETVLKIEDFVKESTEIEDYSSTITQSSSEAVVYAYVSSESDLSTMEIVDNWNLELDHFDSNCNIKASSASTTGMGSFMPGNTKEIVLLSTDLDILKLASRTTQDTISAVPGVLGVDATLADQATRAQIEIDPIKARAMGFTAQQLAGMVYTTMVGADATDITIDNKEYAVTVEYPDSEYQNMNDIEGIYFANTAGKSVALTEMAQIIYTDSPQTIYRDNGQYQASLTINMTSDQRDDVSGIVDTTMQKIVLPQNVTVGSNMVSDMMSEEFAAIGKAILIAVFLVFMVMAIQFESIRYAGIIMFCVPFSLIGSILLLLLTDSKISMTSLMGFLMLSGIVVNNGILLIDTANQNRKYMNAEKALVEAGVSRVRPILMTTLTTILSMVPMAIGIGDNAETMQGMAVVIVGGLIASTILTLLLLPTFYMIIHKHQKNKMNKKQNKGKNGDLENTVETKNLDGMETLLLEETLI